MIPPQHRAVDACARVPGPTPRSRRVRACVSSHALRLAALLTALSLSPAWAAAPPPAERRVHEVRRAAGEIRVDGDLGDPGWAGADVIVAAIETYPGDNVESPARTECRLAYDERTLYVGIRALDPEPGKIRAHYTDRDAAFDDDFVGVIFDTFDDARRAYEFFVNPLGVQMDLVMDDVSRNEDSSWDAIWDSAGRVTADGFVVEMAIPFAELRFPAGAERQTWGLDVARIWPRGQRYIVRAQAQDRNRDCYLCQVSRVAGFAGVRPGRSVELDPTVTATAAEERDPFPDAPLESSGTDTEAGLTARWGVTPSITLLGALNPDFSQVEADSAQLDVNTQFALFYEEKRPFFLEGADFFSTPIQAVYTRTVADPAWGAKASGKAGRGAFGVFVADDDVTNLLLPGKEDSELTAIDASNLTGVARYRHDVGRGSTLGVLATARQGDGYDNAVAGLDGMLRLSKADTLTFQVLRSATEYPDEVAGAGGQSDGELDGTAAVVAYRHGTREWAWQAEIESYGRDFRADSGFVPQVDYRQASANVFRTWWGKPEDWYSQIQLGTGWDYSEDQDGRLLENEIEVAASAAGPMQSHLETLIGHRTRSYGGVLFDQDYGTVWGEVRPNGALEIELGVDFGDRLDYANVRNGTVLGVEPEIEWRAGRHLSLEAAYLHEQLDVDGGRLYTARLAQLRAVWQFSLRTFLRVITQYSDVTRDPALYRDPVDASEQELFNQVLLSYKLNPQTVFFLGYSDRAAGFANGADSGDLTTAARTVFIKLGYAWLP
jgi:hypothetical protein